MTHFTGDFDFGENNLVRKMPTKPDIGRDFIKHAIKTKIGTPITSFQGKGYVIESKAN